MHQIKCTMGLLSQYRKRNTASILFTRKNHTAEQTLNLYSCHECVCNVVWFLLGTLSWNRTNIFSLGRNRSIH